MKEEYELQLVRLILIHPYIHYDALYSGQFYILTINDDVIFFPFL
ncbi:hypothetical protein VDT1_3137 [Vibrio sp. 16]|nr:hypothetical protein VDT1_3137 [Vibrio sp. 16]